MSYILAMLAEASASGVGTSVAVGDAGTCVASPFASAGGSDRVGPQALRARAKRLMDNQNVKRIGNLLVVYRFSLT